MRIAFPVILAAVVLVGIAVTVLIQISIYPSYAIVWPGAGFTGVVTSPTTYTITWSGFAPKTYIITQIAVFGSAQVTANYTSAFGNVSGMPPTAITPVLNITVTDPLTNNYYLYICGQLGAGYGAIIEYSYYWGLIGYIVKVIPMGNTYVLEPVDPTQTLVNTVTPCIWWIYYTNGQHIGVYNGRFQFLHLAPQYISNSSDTSLSVVFDTYVLTSTGPSYYGQYTATFSTSFISKVASGTSSVTWYHVGRRVTVTYTPPNSMNSYPVLLLYPAAVYAQVSTPVNIQFTVTPVGTFVGTTI